MKGKHRYAYAKKRVNTLNHPLTSPSLITTKLFKLYQDCRIPLDRFLDCLFDKDYERLIISGEGNQDELLIAWEKIYLEYSEIVSSGSGSDLFQKMIEINSMYGKIFLVRKIVYHLYFAYCEDDIKILYQYGMDGGITESDTYEQRCVKLNDINNRVKTWEVNLQALHKEYEEIQTENTESKGGREIYEDGLSNISTYRKYSIRECDITVRQYVKGLKAIEQYAIKLQLHG